MNINESHTVINLITDEQLIKENELVTTLYKALSFKQKNINRINKKTIIDNLKSYKLVYHPMWIAKILIHASRHPFPPKKVPYVVFVDAHSGYRGLLSHVPGTKKVDVDPKTVNVPKIKTKNQALKYIKDVQKKQIERLYLLKKPGQEIVDYSLCHLPLWIIKFETEISGLGKTILLNANTGAIEDFIEELIRKESFIAIEP